MLDDLLAFKASPSSWQDSISIEWPRKVASIRHHHRRDKSKAAEPVKVYPPEVADASKGRLDASTLSAALSRLPKVLHAGTAGRWGSLGMSTR